MSFTLTLAKLEDSLATVAAEGEATASDFPSTDNVHFDNLLGHNWDGFYVTLDMDRVTYIDSSAIGWLLSAHKSFRAGGGKIALHSIQPQVRQILEILNIDRVIPLAHVLASAKTALLPYRATTLSV